jgi:hypothetical protein
METVALPIEPLALEKERIELLTCGERRAVPGLPNGCPDSLADPFSCGFVSPWFTEIYRA